MIEKLEGYKTYIVGIATLLYAIGGGIAKFHDWNMAAQLISTALLGMGIRQGITNGY